MLILNGFLRGLWVGIVAVFVWVVIAEMTGWDLDAPLEWGGIYGVRGGRRVGESEQAIGGCDALEGPVDC